MRLVTFRKGSSRPRVGVRIGDFVLDESIGVLAVLGMLVCAVAVLLITLRTWRNPDG